MPPSAARSNDDFTRTRWSMVQRLHAPQPGVARNALVELALRYWYPVYAYARRCGHAPEIAQDITQAFFRQIGVEARGAPVMPGGRFRAWLLQRLDAFLASDWHELADGEAVAEAPSLEELEQRHGADLATPGSPEQVFQRGFALEVLARGFKALQDEARQTGHLDMYEALAPFLSREPVPGQYEEIGRRLGIRPLVVVVALKRLRQRFRELVQQELADTVVSAEERETEQRVLLAALGERT